MTEKQDQLFKASIIFTIQAAIDNLDIAKDTLSVLKLIEYELFKKLNTNKLQIYHTHDMGIVTATLLRVASLA